MLKFEKKIRRQKVNLCVSKLFYDNKLQQLMLPGSPAVSVKITKKRTVYCCVIVIGNASFKNGTAGHIKKILKTYAPRAADEGPVIKFI